MKYMNRKDVEDCDHHKRIMNEAARRLEKVGEFSIDEVLKATKDTLLKDVLRWDHMRVILGEQFKCDLVPLNRAWFKLDADKRKSVKATSRYIAGVGRHGAIAGFANMTAQNGDLVVACLEVRRKRANGTDKAYDSMATSAREALQGDPHVDQILPRKAPCPIDAPQLEQKEPHDDQV